MNPTLRPTEWDLFTKSNDAVQTYLWTLYPALDRELLLDAFRARMMFERPEQQWEPHVERMLNGEIECGAMVRHYRHSLIYDLPETARIPAVLPSRGNEESVASGKKPRRSKRTRRGVQLRTSREKKKKKKR